MSPSRNDPCPCGSGAKYKRCCLEKHEADARRLAAEERAALPVIPEPTDEDLALEDELDRDPWLAAAVDRPFDEGLAPWALACWAESDELFQQARARDPEWSALPAVPGEVEVLGDAELKERLAELGVDPSLDAFLALAQAATERGEPSGWAIAAEWRKGRTLSRPERDFLGIAACVLWERWFSDVPSREMLEDEIEEGYTLRDEGRRDDALEVWEDVLEVVLARLRPEGKTLADSPAAGEPGFLGEWLDDWLDDLHEHAHDDPAEALAGLKLTETLLERLPEQGGPSGGTTRAARSLFLLALGRDSEGLAEARRLRDEHPDLALGYVALADFLVAGSERDPERLAEAVSVLSSAQLRPVTDGADWKLDERHREALRLLRRARAGS